MSPVPCHPQSTHTHARTRAHAHMHQTEHARVGRAQRESGWRPQLVYPAPACVVLQCERLHTHKFVVAAKEKALLTRMAVDSPATNRLHPGGRARWLAQPHLRGSTRKGQVRAWSSYAVDTKQKFIFPIKTCTLSPCQPLLSMYFSEHVVLISCR